MFIPVSIFFFFFNDTATTEIYTLSLHDALPISFRAGHHLRDHGRGSTHRPEDGRAQRPRTPQEPARQPARQPRYRRADRKSTRLNSSHSQISYAVFCLKKKKNNKKEK